MNTEIGPITRALSAACAVIALLTAACTPIRPLEYFTIQPDIVCLGESVEISWAVPHDGSCESCPPARAISPPADESIPDTAEGSVSATPEVGGAYHFAGSQCRGGACEPVGASGNVRVVFPPMDDNMTVWLEGDCGPRWWPHDLEARMSKCVEIVEVCTQVPGELIALTGTTADGLFRDDVLLGGAEGLCTDAFNGGGKIFSGERLTDLVNPLRFRCGTTSGGTGEIPADILITVALRCRADPECT